MRKAGMPDVVGALTNITATFGRVSIHGVREESLRAQLDAACCDLVLQRSRGQPTSSRSCRRSGTDFHEWIAKENGAVFLSRDPRGIIALK